MAQGALTLHEHALQTYKWFISELWYVYLLSGDARRRLRGIPIPG